MGFPMQPAKRLSNNLGVCRCKLPGCLGISPVPPGSRTTPTHATSESDSDHFNFGVGLRTFDPSGRLDKSLGLLMLSADQLGPQPWRA
jgi:hypothetical protein